MGIEPYQVAASLTGVISQRLVRRNCEYCIVPEEIPAATSRFIKKVTEVKTLKLQSGLGCTICRNTGFFDRVGAFQFFEINEPIRELISQRPSPTQLEQLSRVHGLRSLKEETLLLAAKGLTSVSEVMSALEEVDEPEIETTPQDKIIDNPVGAKITSTESEPTVTYADNASVTKNKLATVPPLPNIVSEPKKKSSRLTSKISKAVQVNAKK